MGRYTLIPLDGNYRASLTFEALDLDMPSTYRMDEEELATFAAAVAVHNGIWLMLNQWNAILVQVYAGKRKTPVTKLMLLDGIFAPRKVRFVPCNLAVDEDGENYPEGAEGFLTVASLVEPVANDFYYESSDTWEDDDATGMDIIRETASYLLTDDTPWKGVLFSNRQYVNHDDDNRLVAECWIFMDGSVLYLTEEGPMMEDAFQQYVVTTLKCGYYDTDLKSWMTAGTFH